MRRLAWLIITFLLLSFGSLLFVQVPHSQPVLAQTRIQTEVISPQQAIARLFTTPQIESNWFESAFLSQVPTTQVQQIINSLKTALGSYKTVQTEGNNYLVIFENGSVPTKIALNSTGQISGLLFQSPHLTISLEEVSQQFKLLPGKVSVLIREGQTEQLTINATTPLVVASAFKLAVLETLNTQIIANKRSWRDVVELQPQWKSLPSGFLQTWFDGSLLTIQSLAALMISQSDNTATDSLINIIGREEVEKLTTRNRPFLTTREAFILKLGKNEDLLKRYRTGNENERRLVLEEVAKRPLPEDSEFNQNSIVLDVEWFFTSRELCDLMDKVKDLPLMSINPGVVNSKDWERVAYKGGSEPGVLNLTTWLKAKDKNYCVTATWNNNAPLDEERFFTLYGGLISNLNHF